MSFDNVFREIISNIQISIKNGLNFNIQIISLNPGSDTGEYLPSEKVNELIEKFCLDDLRYKPLNQKAFEGMKRAWESKNPGVPFTPKKQPSEMLCIFVTPSENELFITYSLPKSMKNYVYYCEPSDLIEQENRYIAFCRVSSGCPFKEKDNVVLTLFKQMKDLGIYVEEEDDEVITNYLE